MKTGNAVRKVMKLKNIGVNQLADRMGKSSRLVSERLGQDNISVKKLDEMLRVMDYKILIVPQNVQIKEDWYELTVDDEPNKLNLDALLSDPEPDEKPKYAPHRTGGNPIIKLTDVKREP